MGVLPSQNLPKKSHPSKILQKQRSIIRHPQPSLANCSNYLAQQPTSINDISQQFSQMKLSKWQIFFANDFVDFTYYTNIDHHHVAGTSLLIKDNSGDSSGLDFSTSFHGRCAAEISNQLSFKNFSLYEMLHFLKQQSICKGYASVPDQSQWICLNGCISYPCNDRSTRFVSIYICIPNIKLVHLATVFSVFNSLLNAFNF